MYKKRPDLESKYSKKGGVLVLCIDRDNDLGEKTGIKGPVMGREENLIAARELLIADPGESDANSIYGAVKELDGLRSRNITANIATLTGDTKVGTVSDQKLCNQLDKVLAEYEPEKVVFVSDGAEDEFLIPVVQSKVPIMSVKRIIVRQSVKLESDYYVMVTFFKEVLSDARTRRVLLGIPAIILITYAVYGNIAWRFTIGLTGVYLVIKGFQLEDIFEAFAGNVKASLSRSKLSFFLYVLTAIFAGVGIYQGYNVYTAFPASASLFTSSLAFAEAGLVYYLIAAISLITGQLLLVRDGESKPFQYLTYYALAFSAYIMFENAISYVTTSANAIRLVLSVVASFMILFVALVTEKIAFSTTAPYIERVSSKPSRRAKKEILKKPVKVVVM